MPLLCIWSTGQHCPKILKPPQSLPLQMAERPQVTTLRQYRNVCIVIIIIIIIIKLAEHLLAPAVLWVSRTANVLSSHCIHHLPNNNQHKNYNNNNNNNGLFVYNADHSCLTSTTRNSHIFNTFTFISRRRQNLTAALTHTLSSSVD